MSSIPIIDGHIDLAWNYTAIGRRFESSIEIKHQEDRHDIIEKEGLAAVGLPETQKGNVRVLFGTIWVETESSLYPTIGPKFSSLDEAKKLAKEQLDYYRSLSDHGVQLITTVSQLDSILFSEKYQIGIIPLIEGADLIYDYNDLDFWYKQGIRIIAPVWQKNQYAGCTELGGGLTPAGRKFIRKLSEYRIIIDVAHMSDRAVDMTFEQTDGMIINTHTACRHFTGGERLISDRQIMQIHDRGGVIGIMTWDRKLKDNPPILIKDYVDHVEYIGNLTGCVDNIAIGSSMDGGYGVESLPKGMKSIESLDSIADEMCRRNFPEKDVRSVLYNNWYRVLLSALGASTAELRYQ